MVRVFSETARLRRVMMHQPGPELDRVTPDKMGEYLIEELLATDRAAHEHRGMTELLKRWGVEVIDPAVMLRDLLTGSDREMVVERIMANHPRKDEVLSQVAWRDMDPNSLTDWLITGYEPKNGQTNYPLVNLMFTRDSGAVIGSTYFSLSPKEVVRKREAAILEVLVETHPYFQGTNLVSLTPASYSAEAPNPAEMARVIEGGDIIVVNDKIVAIGCGYRTGPKAVEDVARIVLNKEFERVLRVNMVNPSRNHMHLDTIFTIISADECIIHAPPILDKKQEHVEVEELWLDSTGKLRIEKRCSFLDALSDLNVELDAIICGGDDPINQQREQWWDGANSFAVAPGVIFLYDRVEATLAGLNRRGYDVINVDDPRRLPPIGMLPTRKTVFLVESNEISRARGGPHCLTMPLVRD